MKFHRVEGELPLGVCPCFNVTAHTVPGLFDDFFSLGKKQPVTLTQVAERLVSNKPTKFTLDVPEKSATETARVLRAMADELSPPETKP